MYKVTNTSSKPVFVEGVCLGASESTEISVITENLRYIARKGIIMISSEKSETSNTVTVLTEEGTETKKKRKSSKTLNE